MPSSRRADLPAGALNVITGPGGAIGDRLADHPDAAMITFTGSAEVDLGIRRRAGLKPVTLELGSNSAVIIGPDANLDEAVPRCVAGSFAHSGQVGASRSSASAYITRFGVSLPHGLLPPLAS